MTHYRHADSQVDLDEASRLTLTALASDEHRGSLRLVGAHAVGSAEMIGCWSLDTPDGVRWRVAIVAILDAEPLGFDETYTDETDARAVYAHLVDEHKRVLLGADDERARRTAARREQRARRRAEAR